MLVGESIYSAEGVKLGLKGRAFASEVLKLSELVVMYTIKGLDSSA
jgi:hypothetical protein